MVTVGVDSYADETQLADYAAKRGLTLEGDASVALIKAMDFLSIQQWLGDKTDPLQQLDFPRNGETTVPQSIIIAQILLALDADNGINLMGVPELAIKRQKVDVIETEYATGDNSVYTAQSNTQVDVLLKPFLQVKTPAFSYYVERA